MGGKRFPTPIMSSTRKPIQRPTRILPAVHAAGMHLPIGQTIIVINKPWRSPIVEHHDQFWDFGGLGMNPAPTEYIPLWIGALSEPTFNWAACFADDIITNMRATI